MVRDPPLALVLALTISTAPATAESNGGLSAPQSSGTSVTAPAPVYIDASNRSSKYKTSTDKIAAYWTPERIAAAKPLDTPTVDAKTLQVAAKLAAEEQGPVRSVAPTLPMAGLENAGLLTAKTRPMTVGKAYFRKAGNTIDTYCSAAVITSKKKNLIITAGHCVHGGKGKTWHKNWVFYPGYSNGAVGKIGKFPATTFPVFNDWKNYGESGGLGDTFRGYNSDVAFVAVKPAPGNLTTKAVESVVGGLGLFTGGEYAYTTEIFGYPKNINDGKTMQNCSGKTTSARKGTPLQYYDFVRLNCSFKNGASGGPWIFEYNDKNGSGMIRSLTSFIEDGKNYTYSPYFGQAKWDLYQQALKM